MKMSRLKELIDKLCPQGVQYKTLSSIGQFTRGKRFVHADSVEEGIPCIHYGELYTHYGVWTKSVKSHVRKELESKLRYAKKNDVIIVGAGENNMDIGIAVAYLGDEIVAVHDACYIFSHEMNAKYISYCLRTDDYHNQIKKFVSTGKICAISADGIGKAVIPVPPIEIQDEIVDILDELTVTFNDISQTLHAELDTRKKQFSYYKEQLFKFDKRIDVKPLWSLTIWDKRFQGVEKEKQPKVFKYPVLLANDLFDLKEEKGDVFLLSTGSETGWTTDIRAGKNVCVGNIVSIPWGKAGTVDVQSVVKYYSGKFVTGDNRILTSNNPDIIDTRYLFYFLTSKKGITNTFYRGSGIRHPDMRKVLHIEVPLPDISIQRKMVEIISEYETAFTDISDTIIREIDSRNKQYKYYRDQTLKLTNVSEVK